MICKKGNVLDREEFNKMKSEYYEFRGWDVNSGLPTRRKLKELELDDVADSLADQGLVR